MQQKIGTFFPYIFTKTKNSVQLYWSNLLLNKFSNVWTITNSQHLCGAFQKSQPEFKVLENRSKLVFITSYDCKVLLNIIYLDICLFICVSVRPYPSSILLLDLDSRGSCWSIILKRTGFNKKNWQYGFVWSVVLGT